MRLQKNNSLRNPSLIPVDGMSDLHNTNPLLQVVAFSIKTTPFGVVG